MGSEKEGKNERQDESTDGTLAMVELKAEIGQREKPAEKRHRAVEIVVGDGVESAGTLQEREIVGDQSEDQEYRAQSASSLTAGAQETDVGAQAQHVGEHGQK
jgi:hypothetical protein